MKICAIIFRHNEDDLELWDGFNLTEEDEDKIVEILSKYDTDGYSIRGTAQDIANSI